MERKQNQDTSERFFAEVRIRLNQAGYAPQPVEDGLLPVDWRGSRLCRVTSDGGVRFRSEDVAQDDVREAFDGLCDIVRETAEYMRLMEEAPPLKATGLDESYKLLADFNGAVLAGHTTRMGVQFVTWEWDYSHTGMWQGHYFGGDYAKARQDFALRSGLLERDQLYTPEQQTEIYRAIHETLESDYSMTDERQNLLESAAEQIERSVPDLRERVELSNQKELAVCGEAVRGQEMLL